MRKALLVVGVGIGVGVLICAGYAGYKFVVAQVAAQPDAPVSSGGSIALSVADGGAANGAQGANLGVVNGTQSTNNSANNSTNNANITGNSRQNNENSGNNSQAAQTTYKLPTLAELKSYEQYKDAKNAMFGELTVGTGPEAKAGSKVTINYRGWLTDGTPFDDSYQRGKPLSFTIGQHQVVLGMEEGVYGMKVGGRRRIIIPASVGYGSTANGPVPANSMMVFDVELVGSE